MTKPLFTITFTQEQAVDFIKQQIKDNYSSIDEFDVVIQQKTTPDDNLENPWIIPDADGWFTHDPEWKSEECPPYIEEDRKVVVILSGKVKESYPYYADTWVWSVDNDARNIVKWKYVD